MQRLWQSTADSLKSLSRSRRQLAFIAAVVFVIALLTALTSNRPSSIRVLPKENSMATPAFPENQALAIPVPGSEDALKARTEAAQSLVSGGPRASYFPTAPSDPRIADRKSTRLNSSHSQISYAVFCLKKKK